MSSENSEYSGKISDEISNTFNLNPLHSEKACVRCLEYISMNPGLKAKESTS